jgi:organic radical activating enzyme
MPAVFVRLAGCSLACYYCDTEFESGMASKPLTVMQVIDQVVQLMPDRGTERQGLVVLTGGEPMRQDIRELVCNLRFMCFDVQIETHGLHYLDFGPGFDAVPSNLSAAYYGSLTIVCSPKTGKVSSELAKVVGHWKYVIADDDSDAADGLPWLSTQNHFQRSHLARPWDYAALLKLDNIWVSPKDEQDPVKNGKNMQKAAAVAMRFGYRLTLQQHKILGLR